MRSAAPLSGGQRISRGFRRLGIALALPTVLIGLPVSGLIGFSDAYDISSRYEQVLCLRAKLGARQLMFVEGIPGREIDPAKSGCPTFPLYRPVLSDLLEPTEKPNLLVDSLTLAAPGIAITAALAISFYGLAFGAGWILSGFARD